MSQRALTVVFADCSWFQMACAHFSALEVTVALTLQKQSRQLSYQEFSRNNNQKPPKHPPHNIYP